MGIFRQFPYSNFHDMNMDEIIKICRELQDAWAATSAEWASYKDFIDNYFATLDVSQEVLQALRTLAASGELNTIIDPVIATETAAWLAEHITITQGETVIDDTLSVAGAAADAAAVGARFAENDIKYNNRISEISEAYGLNIFNPYTCVKNIFLNATTGEPESNNNYIASDFIAVNGPITFKMFEYTGDARYRIYKYDSNRNFINRVIASPSDYPNGFTISATGYVRINIDNTATSNANIYKYMTAEGSVQLTEFIPYYTALDRISRNYIHQIDANTASSGVLDVKIIDNAYVNSTGIVTAGGAYSLYCMKIPAGCIINKIAESAYSDGVFYGLYENEPEIGSTSYYGVRYGTSYVDEINNIRISEAMNWIAIRFKQPDIPKVSIFNYEFLQQQIFENHYKGMLSMFTRIGCVGDSFTAGTIFQNTTDRVVARGSSYPANLTRLYGVEAVNYGASGATTGDYLTRADGLPKILNDDPCQLYIIALGLNDKTQNVDIGTINDIHEDYTENPNTFIGNMGRIIAQIREHAPDAKIVLLKSLWPVNIPVSYTPSAYYNYNNDALIAIADHYDIPVIETIDNYFLRKYANLWIGYHPTAPLYAGLAREIANMIEKDMWYNTEYYNDFYILN